VVVRAAGHARETDVRNWSEYLRHAINTSDRGAVSRLKEDEFAQGDAWDVHLDLFPAVQEVLNPPFINPHLPKMYAVCRDLRPYLEEDDIPALLYMESMEYARRTKLKMPPQGEFTHARIGFDDIEGAIRKKSVDEAALLFTAFLKKRGAPELARRLLLLGSGYLEQSLGHSISCTSFILLEIIARKDQDPWPALVLLSDYFCKGGFGRTTTMEKAAQPHQVSLPDNLLRATAGSSFLDIHHTITLYAIERARHLFSADEHRSLIESWLAWMGEKEPHPVSPGNVANRSVADYEKFYTVYSTLDAQRILEAVVGLAATTGRFRLPGRFLIKGLCDLYQGDYNPHYVTGLGAALWAAEQCRDQPSLASSALHQYLAFLCRSLGKAA